MSVVNSDVATARVLPPGEVCICAQNSTATFYFVLQASGEGKVTVNVSAIASPVAVQCDSSSRGQSTISVFTSGQVRVLDKYEGRTVDVSFGGMFCQSEG